MAYCKFCKKDVTPTVKVYNTDGEFAVEYYCPICGSLIEEKLYPKPTRAVSFF
jgi:predicted RNA-binding Zn-ribbon protein involved in translation (DUF1610 family)